MTSLLDVLTKTIPNEDPNSFKIKLPPVQDLGQMAKYVKDFHTSLTALLISPSIQGEAIVESVENGSIWVTIFVRIPAAMTMIASLTWSSAVVYKKIQEGRLVQEQVRSYGLKNDAIEEIKNLHNETIRNLVEIEAKHIQNEHFDVTNHEELERIKKSVSILSELIYKGAEIQPALTAPEDVSNLFPDATKMISIESKVKKLTEGN